MTPTISFDRNAFAEVSRRLLAVKRVTVERHILDQARLLGRDLIRLTPPFNQHAITESFNVQRRTGESAVRRDIGRVFQPISNLAILKKSGASKLKRSFERALERRDLRALRAMLESAGFQVELVETVEPERHEAARGATGRVRKGHRPAYVLDERALKRYVEAKVRDVGKTKAGWLAAADALNVPGIPQWIRRHAGATPGLIRFERGPADFAVVLGNLVAYAGEFAGLNIVQAALDHRLRAMRLQTERILEAGLRKAA